MIQQKIREQIPDMTHDIQSMQHDGSQQGEIILYQPDETVRLEVRLEDDTVWLTQAQMAELFGKDRTVIGRHIRNVYNEGELQQDITCAKFAHMGSEGDQRYEFTAYNLDVIISVGYRVKSQRGMQFRIWATSVLKRYILQGTAIHSQLHYVKEEIDNRLNKHDQQIRTLQEKVDFFVRTNQPPVEGVFFEGQIFDAYRFVETLVKSAQREIILIDNYVDATVFDLLEKRGQGVDATIYTEHVGQSLLHLQQLNQQQYRRRIEVKEYNNRFHDRFLILDDALYHFGASFKDLGKRLFAFELMGIDKEIILNQL